MQMLEYDVGYALSYSIIYVNGFAMEMLEFLELISINGL